jgi:2,4-dienoyl-CoA reductase-like NADH-dependent reductase (Old Yellow Enzyme family)
MTTSALFEPGKIGSLELANRIVRAGTSETMATNRGEVTDDLVRLYEGLAQGGVALAFTGHLYCAARGQYARRQTGIYDDSLIGGLARIATGVRRHGGRVFAQLAHAGSQSRVPGVAPLAPSPGPNALTGRDVGEADETEIADAVQRFGAAARRAVEAGFDGVHIHGANGYLISEFSSPLTNRREDGWGGSAEKRDRFALEVARSVRAAVPPGMPVTMKLGLVDAMPGGLAIEESTARAARLADAGIDALEVSVNVMARATDSARQYVAVGPRRAVADLLIHRAFGSPAAEAYFIPWARALRPTVGLPLIVAGGMRSVETMEAILRERAADFVAMARPLIREPDLVAQLARGRTGTVDCTSCNICLMHEGHHSLRCWRTPRVRLLEHALYRVGGGFRR